MKYIKYLILLSVIVACKKPNNSEAPKPTPNYNLILNWKKPLTQDSSFVSSIMPILSQNGNVIFSAWNKFPYEVFTLFNGESGVSIWNWHDYFRNENIFYGNSILNLKNKIVLCSNNATYSFDAESGVTNWKSFIDSLYGSSKIYSNDSINLYHGFSGEIGTFKFYLLRSSVNSLKWERVLSIYDSSNTFDHLVDRSIAFYKNQAGQSNVFITLTNGGTTENCALALSYNLNTSQYNWINNYNSKYGSFDVTDAQQDDSSIFVFASTGSLEYLVAISKLDGHVIWSKSISDFGTSLYKYGTNLVYTTNRSNEVKFIDCNSGTTLKTLTINVADNSSGTQFDFHQCTQFKNYLFATLSHGLVIIDLSSQEVVFNKNIVDPSRNISNGVAINEKLRYFYVADEQYAYCFKLPDIVKY